MRRPVVASDRRYVFDATPAEVWAALEHVDGYGDWLPFLDRLDGAALRPGAEWQCVVRSPLRRTLRFTIAIDAVETSQRIVARLAGDLVGPAEVTVAPFPVVGMQRTEVRLVSALTPRDPVVAAITRIARPAARRAHDVLVDRGARQFAVALR